MQAAIAAANRVAAQLRKGGKDPKDAKKIKPFDLKKAFDDAKVRGCASTDATSPWHSAHPMCPGLQHDKQGMHLLGTNRKPVPPTMRP